MAPAQSEEAVDGVDELLVEPLEPEVLPDPPDGLVLDESELEDPASELVEESEVEPDEEADDDPPRLSFL